MRSRHSRRGVLLTITVMVITILGAMLALMVMHSGQAYRARETERLRVMARQIAASTADYARMHAKEWSSAVPSQPIELKAGELVEANIEGRGAITFSAAGGAKTCHIMAEAGEGVYRVRHELDLSLRPGSQPAL